MALKQPFPENYGLNDAGCPSDDLKLFSRSDKARKTALYISCITFHPDMIRCFLDLVAIPNKTLEFATIYMYACNKSELIQLAERNPYLNKLSTTGLDFVFSADIDPCIDQKNYRRLNYASHINYNKHCISNLKQCKSHDLIRLNVAFLMWKSQNLMFEDSPTDFIAHSSQFIINLKSKTAILIESNQHANIAFERTKEHSIEIFLQEYLDENIQVAKSSKTVNLQGNTDLCGAWSLYLLLIYLLNDHLTWNQIYNIFNKYGQSKRNMIIMQFLYYTNSLNLTKIPNLLTSASIDNNITIPVL